MRNEYGKVSLSTHQRAASRHITPPLPQHLSTDTLSCQQVIMLHHKWSKRPLKSQTFMGNSIKFSSWEGHQAVLSQLDFKRLSWAASHTLPQHLSTTVHIHPLMLAGHHTSTRCHHQQSINQSTANNNQPISQSCTTTTYYNYSIHHKCNNT